MLGGGVELGPVRGGLAALFLLWTVQSGSIAIRGHRGFDALSWKKLTEDALRWLNTMVQEV
jgi:hypothetical protein